MEREDEITTTTQQASQNGYGFILGALVGVLFSALVAILRLAQSAPRRRGLSVREAAHEPAVFSSPLPRSEAGAAPVSSQPFLESTAAPGSPLPARAKRYPAGFTAPEAQIPPTGMGATSKPSVGGAPRPWSQTTKYIVGVGLFLFLVFLLYFSRSTIPLIIFAALLAFIVHPVVRFFQTKLKMGKGASVLLTYVLVILVILLIPIVLLPAIIESLNFITGIELDQMLQSLVDFLDGLGATVEEMPVLGPVLVPMIEQITQSFKNFSSLEGAQTISYDVSISYASGLLARTLGTLANVLGPLVSAFMSLVFMLLISFYMSLSSDQIREAYPKLIPASYGSEIGDLIMRIGNIWRAFLRGQLALMVFIGFMVWIGNLLLGTRQALLLGIIAGLMELIPNIGPIIATIPAVILALIFGSSHFDMSNTAFALVVVIFYVLIQILENQVVVPKILGDAVDLPPLVVIIGVTIGGATIGILGVFLATPVISTGKAVFMYLYNKILEPPPEAAPPEEKPSFLDRVRNLTGKIKLPWRRKAEA